MLHRLSETTLATLPSSVARPSYDRRAVTPGIVHIGVGAFHRAHQAVYVDDCLAAGERDWGIVGASLQSAATATALNRQDGLYTLAVRGVEGEGLRVIGSIGHVLVAPHSPAALLDALTDPRVRIVTLTVTEKAYLRNAAGDLDAGRPGIVADLADPAQPKTVHGFLVEALARRLAAGVQPFTILSCDNLPANGETLHRLLVQFATLRSPALADHVRSVSCPSSMVDRIVPATTDADRQRISGTLGVEDAWPVVTEPYSQWVVEDRFPSGRPAWENSGVTMVEDVRPYEEMKLRLLNGAHSAIACLGLLCGHDTVAKSFGDPAIRRFVRSLWDESAETLPRDAGLDIPHYIASLMQRFDNPALAHRTAQIANDSSQKLPQRIVAPALECLAAGRPADHLPLVIAAWVHAAESRGRALPEGLFTDPLDASGILASQRSAPDMVAAVFDATGFAAASSHRAALEAAVAARLETIREAGMAATLARLTEGNPA